MTLFGWNITFKKQRKQHKVRAKGFTAKRWDAKDTQLILDLNNEGMSPREISEQLGNRTPASVASRLTKVRKK